MKERNSTIELLRFLLMLSVCFLHILVHGKGLKQMGGMPEVVESCWQLVALAFFFPSVCCFMFISGYYGIKLKLDKVISLFVQAFLIFHICGTVGPVLTTTDGLGGGNIIDVKQHLLHFEPITTHIWWFLTEYVCIMFLSPFIESGIKSVSRKTFGLLLFGLFLFNCVGLYITRFHTGSSLLGMLFVYLLARYFKLYISKVSMKCSFLMWLLPVAIVSFLMIEAYKTGHSGISWCLLWYCNPLIILCGIGLFYVFNNLPQFHSKVINWMGRHCLSIYLITEINKPIYKYWATEFDNNFLKAIFLVLLWVFLFMVFDSVQSVINSLVTNSIIKKVKNYTV